MPSSWAMRRASVLLWALVAFERHLPRWSRKRRYHLPRCSYTDAMAPPSASRADAGELFLGTGAGEVVLGLEVNPELGRGAEGVREQPGRLRGDAALASHDLVHPLDPDIELLGERQLGQAHREEK